MKSSVLKRSIVVAGHKTSVSLEDGFWSGLRDIAALRGLSLSELIGTIDAGRHHGNLSSAIRLFVLDFYREGRKGGEREAGRRISNVPQERRRARKDNEGRSEADASDPDRRSFRQSRLGI